MTKRSAAALAAAWLALSSAGAAVAQEPPTPGATEVSGVTVKALRPDWLLSFTIAGDVDDKTFVSSAPLGLNCGGAAYRYQTNPVHECWLRVLHAHTVLLAATAPGRFGVDWTVSWTGCKPVGEGAMCEIVMNDDVSAGATFKKLR